MTTNFKSRGEPLVVLRDGVEVDRIGPDSFQLTCGTSGRILRLNGQERVLLNLVTRLDSYDDVVREYPSRLGCVNRRDVAEFLAEANRLGFTEPTSDPTPDGPALASNATTAGSSSPKTGLNACFDALALVFGWTLSRWTLALLIAASLLASCVLIREGTTITRDLANTHANTHWVALAAMVYLRLLLAVSLPTALLVGMATRIGGGWLRGFGLSRWEGVIPLFDVDTGESFVWMPGVERRRVIWAALLAPLALLSISLIAWSACTDYHGAKQLWLFMVPPAAIAFVIRCNPFAETPAYWLLCDAWDDWRLKEEAEAEAWRIPVYSSPQNRLHRRRRRYGQLRSLFRVVRSAALFVGGGWLALEVLEGVGAVLFLLVVIWWNRDSFGRLLRPWLFAPLAK